MQLIKELRLLTLLFCVVMCGDRLEAGLVYPLEMLTSNGEYYDGSDFNLYVEVIDGQSTIDFIFRNEGSIDSSIARIYFEDSPHLGTANLVGGPGTAFSEPATPKNLPGAKKLEPPFDVTDGFSIGADAPPPRNGINPGEELQLTFDLENNGTFADVISQLNTGALRIGAHVIALPDGSSGSTVAVPGPATLILLGTGAAWVAIRKRRFV